MSGRKELIEYRTPNTKHFLKRDGTIEVEIYKDPVHYLDKGEYKEIDNSLVKTTKGFKNKSNDFKIEFDEKDNDSLVNISCKNKKLSMFPKNINQKISNRSSVKKSKNSLVSNSISYESMYEGVDIDYKVLSNQLKESIILNKIPKENKFVFVINTDLNLILNDDNTISFIDKDKECYKIERPYMVDKNNIYSESVTYELEKIDNGYEITIIADKEWLDDNERAYPIVIDPTITNAQSTSSVIDTYIYDGDTSVTTYNQSILCVGADKDSKIYRTLLKFELPKIPAGFKIIKASGRLTCYPDELNIIGNYDDPLISVHRITQDWTESSAKWSNMHNKYSDLIEDYYIANRIDYIDADFRTEFNEFNLTNLIQKWYNGEPNYGIMLKEYQEKITNKSRPAYYISKDVDNAGTNFAKPLLILTYKNFNGLEDYLSYTTQPHEFGTSYISNYTGNLTTVFNVASTIGGTLPAVLSLIYNTTDVELGIDYGYGIGVKPNLMQILENETIEEQRLVKYLDEDGTIHYFYSSSEDENTYADEEGLGFSLKFEDDKFIMTDSDLNVSTFNKFGNKYYLVEIKSPDSKVLSVSYNSENKITKVTDSYQNEITIEYDINKITFHSPHINTIVNLSNNKISSINVLEDIELIAYNSDGLIEKITNPNGLSIKYDYINDISFKVKKVSEIGKNGNVGNSLEFSYSFDDTKVVDKKGYINTYIFNEQGNVVGITNLGNEENIIDAYGKSYSYGSIEEGTPNKLTVDKSLVKYIDNLIDNSSFEEENSNWHFSVSEMNSTNTLSTDVARSGLKSLEVEIPKSGEYIYRDFQVKKGKKYTFSGYIRGASLLNDSEEFYLDFILSYNDKEEITHITKLTNEFLRYSVTIDYLEDATDDLRLIIKNVDAGHASFYLDDIQLEEGEVANYYNLVNNSSLRNGISDWTIERSNLADDFVDVASISSDLKALRIHSAPQGYVLAEKKFNVSGKSGDTFNFSFWYKNEAITPTAGEGLMPGLWASAYFGYPEDTEYGSCIPARYLNMGSDNWQFFSENFTAYDNYEYIVIRINSFGGANSCYATNFSLYKDLECYSYDYDTSGNLVSVSDLNKQSSELKYDNSNQLISTMKSTGANNVIEYDNKVQNRIVNSFSPLGITNHIDYDSNGNPIKTRIDNRKTLDDIDSEKVYYIRAKGTNKYFYINPDKTIRMKESECSYDKFYIIKYDVISEIDGQEVTKSYYKFKHAFLNNYYIKVINNNVRLMYGDDNNLFEFISNLNNSYSIVLPSVEGEVKKVLSLTDTFNIEVLEYVDDNYRQEFFFEQSDNKLFIESRAEYTDDGRFIKSLTDSLGNETKYEFNNINGTRTSMTDANGNKTNYYYDDKLKISNITKGNHKVSYEYTGNYLSKIKHGTKNYIFNYDEFDNIDTIYLNNNLLIKNYYESYNGNLSKVKYGNNNEINYYYDNFDRIKSVEKSDDLYTNYYDNLGRIVKSISNTDNYGYDYDFAKRLSKYKYNEYSSDYEYDKNNRLITKTEELNKKYLYNYQYNADSVLTKLSILNNDFNYIYDSLGRISQLNINNIYKTNYSYITNGNKTSAVVSSVDDNGINYTYTYDKLGNIIEIYKNNNIDKKFSYDDQSQLIKIEDFTLNQSIICSYDNYGNLLSEKFYSNENLIKENTYEYGDSNWQDLLTKYNDIDIDYDNIGNMIKYGNNILSWKNGRELANFVNDSNNVSYKYNVDGIRTSKVVNGVETKYYLEGSTIIFENKNGNVLYYLYGKDELLGFVYNNEVYYYHKNMFGDIIGILDSSYNEIVTYEYDSWGETINITDNSNIDLSTINPFRYRSYYFDEETSLYYLTSRYYDPKIRRFISADENFGVEGKLISYNNFQYAFNNPINLVDEDGEWPKWAKKAVKAAACVAAVATVATVVVATGGVAAPVVGALTGAAISGGVSALSQAVTTGEINPELVLIDACSGAISGALAVTPIGVGTSIAINATLGGTSYMAGQVVTDQKIDIGDLALNTAAGAIAGYFSGAGSDGIADEKIYKHASKVIKRELRRDNAKYAGKQIARALVDQQKVIKNATTTITKSVGGAIVAWGYKEIPNLYNGAKNKVKNFFKKLFK